MSKPLGVLVAPKEVRVMKELLHNVLELTEADYDFIRFTDDADSIDKGSLVAYAVLVSVGKGPYEFLLGREAYGYTKECGKVQTVGGIKVVPVYSAGYAAARDGAALEELAKDLYSAYRVATGMSAHEDTPYKILYSIDEVRDLVYDIADATGIVAFDFETTELDEQLGVRASDFKATGISVCYQAGGGFFIPLNRSEVPDGFDREVMEVLRPVFEDPGIVKIAHNYSFDGQVLDLYGITPIGRIDDTRIMHHLIDENYPGGLKDLVTRYMPAHAGYEEEIGLLVKEHGWGNLPLEALAKYAVKDADMTWRLRAQFEMMLQRDARVYRFYRNLSIPLMKQLIQAEIRGVAVDREYLEDAVKEATALTAITESKLRNHESLLRYELTVAREKANELIADLEEKLERAESKAKKGETETIRKYKRRIAALRTGEENPYKGINFGSWQQLQQLLYFHHAGFQFKPASEGASTDKDSLESLEDDSGFIELLLNWRAMSKILGTYLIGILERLDANSRLHGAYVQTGTVTGRLSSKNPNMQNMPNLAKIQDEQVADVVYMVKRSIIVPEGHTLMQIDYSQGELRVMAEFAGERTMIEAYEKGEDLHAKLGAQMRGVTLDEFYKLDPKEQKVLRTRAKAGNFGFIYGMSAGGFVDYARKSYRVLLGEDEATDMRNDYFTLYPNLLVYHELYKNKARKFGHVRTLFGRCRHLPNIEAADSEIRASQERAAINSPIQGTLGELTLFAIVMLSYRLPNGCRLYITVHDSILIDIEPGIDVAYVARTAREICENLPTMTYFGKELTLVKMKVDIEVSEPGGNWKNLVPFEEEK